MTHRILAKQTGLEVRLILGILNGLCNYPRFHIISETYTDNLRRQPILPLSTITTCASSVKHRVNVHVHDWQNQWSNLRSSLSIHPKDEKHEHSILSGPATSLRLGCARMAMLISIETFHPVVLAAVLCKTPRVQDCCRLAHEKGFKRPRF